MAEASGAAKRFRPRRAAQTRELAAYDRALELDPQLAEVEVNRGDVLTDNLGRFEEAVADRALELDPRHTLAHINRGNVLGLLGHYEQALAAYDRALELDPQSAIAHTNRGNTLFRFLGRSLEEALAEFDSALGLDPQLALARRNRGDVLLALGRPREALAAYDWALELDSDNVNVLNSLAWLLAVCPEKELREARDATSVSRGPGRTAGRRGRSSARPRAAPPRSGARPASRSA